MSDEIRFEEPPAGRHSVRQLPHPTIAAQLRYRRGEWAMVATRTTSRKAAALAYAIRTATRLRHYEPAGSFEAVARSVKVTDPGGGRERAEHRVYARYVGEEK